MKSEPKELANKAVAIVEDIIKDFNPDKAIAVLRMAEILIEAKHFPKVR